MDGATYYFSGGTIMTNQNESRLDVSPCWPLVQRSVIESSVAVDDLEVTCVEVKTNNLNGLISEWLINDRLQKLRARI
jgi:hypothetical protein